MKKLIAVITLAGFTAACTPVNNATPPYPGLPMPEKHVEKKTMEKPAQAKPVAKKKKKKAKSASKAK